MKVQEKIERAEELDAAGQCWCPCVKDDIPKAKELLSKGKGGAANSVIMAALRRCHGGVGPKNKPVSYNLDLDLPKVELPELPKF